MLQGWGIGIYKRGLNKYMLMHIAITSLFQFFPIFLFGYSLEKAFLVTLLTFVTHLTIDIAKAETYSKFKIGTCNGSYWEILGLDQILHIVFIFVGIEYVLN